MEEQQSARWPEGGETEEGIRRWFESCAAFCTREEAQSGLVEGDSW